MHDTITIPKNVFERLEQVIRRLVAHVEPKNPEAQAVRSEAVALMEDVTHLTDTTAARSKKSGAQVLLDLAEKAEKEGWGSGLGDLAQHHDTYAAEAAEDDLKRIHDDYR